MIRANPSMLMKNLFNKALNPLLEVSKSVIKVFKSNSGKRKKKRLLFSRASKGKPAKSKLEKMHFGTFSPCKPFACLRRGIR